MSLYTSHYPFTSLVSAIFTSFVRLYVRPEVTGQTNLPADGSFLLAANHASHADTAVIYTALPRRLRPCVVAAAAQDYFFDKGPRQMVARTLFNAIPIARDHRGGKNPLRHVNRALREGYGVLIYPEGTRSQDGAIHPFHSGIGRLISAFPGLPVIPVRIRQTDRVMPKGTKIPRPRTVRVQFGSPLYLEALPNDRSSWQTAAAQVREAIVEMQAM